MSSCDVFDNLAKEILLGIDNDYKTIRDAKKLLRFSINGVYRFIEFCQKSIFIYSHDFPPDELREVYKALYKNYKASREAKKARSEFFSLVCYIQKARSNWFDMNIKKSVRPDFVLQDKDGLQIGIEVTSPQTESEALQHSILSVDYQQGMTAAELQRVASKHHVGKVDHINFFQDGSVIGLSARGNTSPRAMRDCYSDQVVKKIDKYIGQVNQFSMFYVLADIFAPLVSSIWEIEEILENIKKHVKMKALNADGISIILMVNSIGAIEYSFSSNTSVFHKF